MRVVVRVHVALRGRRAGGARGRRRLLGRVRAGLARRGLGVLLQQYGRHYRPTTPDTCSKRQPKDQLTCNSCILCGAPPYAKLGPCPLPGPPTPGMRSSFPAPPGLERSSGAWYRGTVHPPPKLWSMGLSGARYTGSKGRAP